MIPVGGIRTGQTTLPYPMPAPVGGLNGRDPLAAMPQADAYLMDNIVPKSSYCEARKGCVLYSTAGLEAPVQTLDVYAGQLADVMLAWAGTTVYNISTGTPVPLKNGMNSANAINAMFSNASDNAQHLISVTGYDTPMHYDGNTLQNLTMTGMQFGTPDQLSFVFTFKGRLYFAQRNRLGFYYLPPGQIQGELTYFDLGAVSKNGGYLVAIASYSEAGETPNDFIVFITSKGECIVYSGSDPSNANAWSLVGRYFGATPVGPRCAVYYNNELTVLTVAGALPFSLIRERGSKDGGGVEGGKSYAVTSKLGKWFTDYADNAGAVGWQGLQYPASEWLILNVPASKSLAGQFSQFIMNTTTRSWCRFTGWDALCFAVFNGRLYFGRYDGSIMLADEGGTDNGTDIRVDCKPAYSYFNDDRGAGPMSKHFQWATMTVACDGSPPLTGKFNVNFKEDTPEYSISIPETQGSEWDEATWDEATWEAQSQIRQVTLTLNKQGYAGSLWVRLALRDLGFIWYSTLFTFGKTSLITPI